MLFKYLCLNSILIGLLIWLLVQAKIWGGGGGGGPVKKNFVGGG